MGDVVDVLAELTSAHPDAEIAAVCVSGLGPCVVQTDAELRPRRPAILYGVDARATREIEEITRQLGADAILERCGKDLSSQAIGPKLAWLRREAGEDWQPQDRWFSAHTYVVARLTGEWVLDHHTASQCDPFYDIRAQDWARDWVEAVLPGLALPRLVCRPSRSAWCEASRLRRPDWPRGPRWLRARSTPGGSFQLLGCGVLAT